MERKKFIKSSLFGFGGISMLSFINKTWTFPPINHFITLEENVHIRHGYYGKEFINNELNIHRLKSIRIDRFLSPSGNMKLFDIEHSDFQLKLGLIDQRTILINDGEQTKEIDFKGSNEVLWSKKDMILSTNKKIDES